MRITGREKIFLWGGAGFLAALLLLQLAISPAVKRTRELARLIPRKERELKEVRRLGEELVSLRKAKAEWIQRIPVQERTLAPLSRLDGWIERSGLRQNIRSIKPSPPSPGGGMGIEILMEKAELPQLTRFLYEVQSSPGGSRIERLTVKPRYTAPRFLEVSLQMVFTQG
jgi:hypothetical protein